MVTLSSPAASATCARYSALLPGGGAMSRHLAISASCRLLYWSWLGKTASFQSHCTTAASISEVGVSQLNSNNLGGPEPS
ncbi:hypothetical protein D9M73_188560 [compost metagenome]